MCTWLVSTIYSLTPPLPELVPVRHGHPRPPEGPRPRRGAAASQIRRQSTGTRSGDLRSSEAYALPIQGYHMDLSTGACGGAGGPGAQPLVQLTLHTRVQLQRTRIEACHFAQHHTVEHHSQTVLRALISTRHTAIFEYRDLVACSGEPIRPGDGRSWSCLLYTSPSPRD